MSLLFFSYQTSLPVYYFMNYEDLLASGYMPTGKYNDYGKLVLPPEDIDEDEDVSYSTYEPETLVEAPECPRIDYIPSLDQNPYEVPDNCYLLNSSTGSLYLKPQGLVDEERFLVLFFKNRESLTFLPEVGARFTGVYVLPSGLQSVSQLLYSDILFKLPNSNKVALIFHKVE